MRNWIFVLTLVSNLIFFSIIPILGINYTSDSNNPLYKIFCSLLSGLSILIILWELFIKNRFTGSRTDYFFLLVPFFFIGIIFFEQPDSSFSYEILKRFLLWSLPAILIGLYYSRRQKELENSIKCWYIVMILMSIGSLVNIYDSLINLQVSEILGERYQTISYTASLAYAINLTCFLFRSHIGINIRFFRISVILCFIIQIISVIGSGGRGGVLVIFFSTLCCLYAGIKYYHFNKCKIGIALLVGFLIIMVSMPFLLSNPMIERGIGRVFSYVTSGGIDMSETSNRDIVYSIALEKIQERPLLGHGIYKHMDIMGYPHNIFLEVTMGGGFIYLFFFLLLSYVFVRRFLILLKKKQLPLILLPLFSYVFILLMFSGTYVETSIFWFTGSYIMCTKY